jgi:hypothetical protein
MSDDNIPNKISVIKPPLTFTNLPTFERSLMKFAAAISTNVVTSLEKGYDFPPPTPPTAAASNFEQQSFRSTEKAYLQYLEHRRTVCATIVHSLSPDLGFRIENDETATKLARGGFAGQLWFFIKACIQGVGAGNAMTHFTNLQTMEKTSSATIHEDYRKITDYFSAIEAQYPGASNFKLWKDFKSHKYVSVLLNSSEFKEFVSSQILPLTEWPEPIVAYNQVVKILDAKRRMEGQNSHGEVSANAARMTPGPCFNCGGKHLSKECRQPQSICSKCGRRGHLPEFCEKVQSFGRDQGQSRERFPTKDQETDRRRDSDGYHPREREVSRSRQMYAHAD